MIRVVLGYRNYNQDLNLTFLSANFETSDLCQSYCGSKENGESYWAFVYPTDEL